MGLFLGIAFQLFARPHDRLSHVLVSPPELEGLREFFYPPTAARTYRTRDGQIHSRDARVELAEIPVLLLRDQVQGIGLEQKTYSELIVQAQRALDRQTNPPRLILDPRPCSIRVAEWTVRLTALEFAVYALLARRRAHACGGSNCPGCERCGLRARDFQKGQVLDTLRNSVSALGKGDERTRLLSVWDRDGDERFLQVRSRVERKIRQTLGAGQWVSQYLIAAGGPRGETLYHLPLAPDLIREA